MSPSSSPLLYTTEGSNGTRSVSIISRGKKRKEEEGKNGITYEYNRRVTNGLTSMSLWGYRGVTNETPRYALCPYTKAYRAVAKRRGAYAAMAVQIIAG